MLAAGNRRRKAFLDMLGVFAEFETNLRRERQMEGIATAAIAKHPGIGLASVSRVLGKKQAA